MTIVYFRHLPRGQIAPAASALSSCRTQLAAETDRGGQAPVRHLWLARLREWRRRRRSRDFLSRLDHHLLKDIGITYAEAEREANKPFWLP